jgi:uncharacterized protein YaiL (DUF2058 family)
VIPESKPGDYDDITRLRLQLAQAELQRDAYQAALRKEVMVVIKDALSENARLKAEVERLTSDLQMEKENEDRLVREWQKANNEAYGLGAQVAALIDEVKRLRKLGTEMGKHLPDTDEANRAYIEFEAGGQS